MLNIIIDTSIYRQNPDRNNAGFTAIERLCEQGIARLHLPFFVEKEFITHRVSELSKKSAEALKAVRSVPRGRLSPEDVQRLQDVTTTLREIKSHIEQAVTEEFQQWIARLGVERHEIKPGHGRRVADAYFGGHLPFRTVKNRNDFPDAFIWETIRDLTENAHVNVCVIVADGGLFSCCEANVALKVFASFDDFFASEGVKNAIADEFFRNRFDEIITALSTQEKDIISEIQGDEEEGLIGKEITHRFIPSDHNDAVINSVGKPENYAFDFKQASYFGNGIIVIPFSFNVDVNAEFYIFKSDYYCMSEEKQGEISVSDWNDHYFEAEDVFSLTVDGHIAVRMTLSDPLNTTVEILTENADISIDSIDSITVYPNQDY